MEFDGRDQQPSFIFANSKFCVCAIKYRGDKSNDVNKPLSPPFLDTALKLACGVNSVWVSSISTAV